MGIYLLPHVRGHRKHTLPLAKKKKKKKDRDMCVMFPQKKAHFKL